MSKDQTERVRKELREAGMTTYGFMKLETNYVPELIHSSEHIEALVYGRSESTTDFLMLIATNQRILIIDCKPFLKNHDEITYEVVAGVKMTSVGPFAGIILHTRVENYSLRFVNIKCAKKFVSYIEDRIVRQNHDTKNKSDNQKRPKYQPYRMPHKDKASTNQLPTSYPNTAVLSTLSDDGTIDSSVVHYLVDGHENFYIVTKTSTKKAQNIAKNNQISLTFHRTNSLKYLQVKGIAEIEHDNEIGQTAINQITLPKHYLEGNKFPPVTKNSSGQFLVLKIIPSTNKLYDYSNTSW